ncbi:MAG: response regulator transcription factor [Desulfatiglans sp.]|jgi:two-component system OmpR family response regulator|nr:response regulator transcription factor [Desulfatiglans sp.]
MRILLVEDDIKIASFIVKGLKEEGFVVDHVADGEAGLDLASSESYDAAIIDIMLPKLDGLSLIDQIRSGGSNLPVLILSAKQSVEDRVKGLQTGSDDYLTKPFAFSELLARIHALIRRGSNLSDTSLLEIADLKVNLLTHEVTRNNEKIELQPREYVLLVYLLRNKDKIVSKTMIMEHVWDYNFDPQTNVVEARMCRLRDKIDRAFDKKLIHTIRGVGYAIKE